MANMLKMINAPVNANQVSESNLEFDYAAAGTQLLSVSKTRSAGVSPQPKQFYIENTGSVAVGLNFKTHVWYDSTTKGETSDGSTPNDWNYFELILKPKEWLYLPTSSIVGARNGLFDLGTAVEDITPSSYITSTITLGANITDATATSITLQSQAGTTPDDYPSQMFRIGDYIMLGAAGSGSMVREIMEVTSIDGATAISVKRGQKGTTASTSTSAADSHSSGDLISFWTEDNRGEYNGSGSYTDLNGDFHCRTFFGKGRTKDIPGSGIVPGSICIKFYEPGYQSCGFTAISMGADSGLSANTEYKFGLKIDGGTSQDISFTTDSSNLKFGGANGILSKIQSAMNAEFTNPDSNLFEKSANVSIVDSDLRFTSNSRKASSAILVADQGTPGSDSLFHASSRKGRSPLAANLLTPVVATLPDDSIYDNLTGDARPNAGKISSDNGFGVITGVCSGTINYDTGRISLSGPPNASFSISCYEKTYHAGSINSNNSNYSNGYVTIMGQALNGKKMANVKIRVYS